MKASKSRINNIDLMVADLLRTKRISCGATQEDLAKVVGVTVQQLQKYEKGVNRISSGKLYQLACYLQVPIEYFFNTTNPIYIDNTKHATDRETITLVKNFNIIKNKNTRQEIINIVRGLTKITNKL